MDVWFTLFVFVVGLSAAVGFSLLLVGYLSVMPVSFGQGKLWLWAAGIVPTAIVALPVVGYTLFLVFSPDGIEPMIIAKWAAIPALTLHLLTVFCFAFMRRREHRKAALQLLAGLGLLALAGGLLYGLGPVLAERAIAAAKTTTTVK